VRDCSGNPFVRHETKDCNEKPDPTLGGAHPKNINKKIKQKKSHSLSEWDFKFITINY
jgi:hypothetical protein